MSADEELKRHNLYREYNAIEVVKIEQDHCEVKADIQPQFLNHGGYVHGGFLFTIADCVSGTTARTDGREYVTQSAHINFIRNVRSGRVYATGSIISRGRKIVIVQVLVRAEDGMLLANVTVNMFCMGGKTNV